VLKNSYNFTISQTMQEFNTSKEGLSDSEAKLRLEKYGANELQTKEEKSKVIMFLEQFKDVLVIILLIAALMSVFIGNFSDAFIMITIVIINAVIGFSKSIRQNKYLIS